MNLTVYSNDREKMDKKCQKKTDFIVNENE